MATRVLQFGTSRFLQAHADLFIHEAREAGQDIGPITVVKTTTGTDRSRRIQAFVGPDGFPVRIRGYEAGQTIDREVRVKSVIRAIEAQHDWSRLEDIFAHETEVVLSNTGDLGFLVAGLDRNPKTAGKIPASFPAKLLRLLRHRFDLGAAPLLILPCELVNANGQELRRTLTELARDWHEDSDFTDWIGTTVTICDTLVDRIVSEPLEPIGAVAEPYALWAIRRVPDMVVPFSHPKVVYTDDLTPFVRLKLHILNLGHTWLAARWLAEGRAASETVREILAIPPIRDELLGLYRDEVVPGFAAHGMAEAADRYAIQTVERFDNPFLNHRLSDIAQNHAIKVSHRVRAFLDWVHGVDPDIPLPRLERLARTALQAH